MRRVAHPLYQEIQRMHERDIGKVCSNLKCGKCLFQQCRSIKFKYFWPLSPTMMGASRDTKTSDFSLDTSGIPKKSMDT